MNAQKAPQSKCHFPQDDDMGSDQSSARTEQWRHTHTIKPEHNSRNIPAQSSQNTTEETLTLKSEYNSRDTPPQIKRPLTSFL